MTRGDHDSPLDLPAVHVVAQLPGHGVHLLEDVAQLLGGQAVQVLVQVVERAARDQVLGARGPLRVVGLLGQVRPLARRPSAVVVGR